MENKFAASYFTFDLVEDRKINVFNLQLLK